MEQLWLDILSASTKCISPPLAGDDRAGVRTPCNRGRPIPATQLQIVRNRPHMLHTPNAARTTPERRPLQLRRGLKPSKPRAASGPLKLPRRKAQQMHRLLSVQLSHGLPSSALVGRMASFMFCMARAVRAWDPIPTSRKEYPSTRRIGVLALARPKHQCNCWLPSLSQGYGALGLGR